MKNIMAVLKVSSHWRRERQTERRVVVNKKQMKELKEVIPENTKYKLIILFWINE